MEKRRLGVRLQKYLADCGVGSRRACERLIAEGAVTVNGECIAIQGTKIDPSRQKVKVRGNPVEPECPVYMIINKPRDVLCTSSDPKGRKTLQELLPEMSARLYSVGRLDRNSEGLLIVTNDGDLSARLTHPRYHVGKTYHVWVDGRLSAEQVSEMKSGIMCDGELLTAAEIRSLGARRGEERYEVVLKEGKNRQIRRMYSYMGLDVRRLLRVSIGPIILGSLRRGEHRHLQHDEVAALFKCTEQNDE